MKRTVIGSLPRMADQPDEAIERALKLQLRYGVQVVSDGEQRFDMIEYFQQIPGLESSPGGLKVAGKIEPMKNSEECFKVVDFRKVKGLLEKLGAEDVEVKASVTGPVTLGVSCASVGTSYYNGPLDENLYLDLIEALTPIVSTLLFNGAWVQLDEPGVSAGFQHPAKAVHYLNKLQRRLQASRSDLERLAVHVCGDLTKIPQMKEAIQDLEIRNLCLAFSGPSEKNNINLPLERILKAHDKRLGVGCVSVAARSIEEVDSQDSVSDRVDSLIKVVGEGRVSLLHPDCGLKKTPLPVAEEILARMMRATQSLIQN